MTNKKDYTKMYGFAEQEDIFGTCFNYISRLVNLAPLFLREILKGNNIKSIDSLLEGEKK